MFDDGKRKLPGTVTGLPAQSQPPEQGTDTYGMFIFLLLSLNSVGNEPYDKPEPIDLHRHHLS
jgi:hypothetical protein